MTVMSGFGSVVGLGFHSLCRRPLVGAVIIIAVAVTTAILASLLAIGEGLGDMMGSGTTPNRILVLSRNAPSELQSVIALDKVAIVRELDGLARDGNGVALASPNVMGLVDRVRQRDASHGAVVIRGWDALGRAVHPEIRIIAGRPFRPGTNEAIIGRAARQQFVRSSLGDQVRLDDVTFRLVGIFDAGGGPLENELLADSASVQTAKRSNEFQSVVAIITSPAALSSLKATVAADPRLELDVLDEIDYRRRSIAPLRTVIDFVAYFVASTTAIGALLGTMAVMTFRVERRAREIATLQALGFENNVILAAIVAEVIGLCLMGSAIGTAAASFLFSGRTIDTSGFSFSMEVTANILVAAICCAILVGLLAGLFSGIAALRRQPARILSRD